MAKGKIEFEISSAESSTAYISLPDHPGEGVSGASKKQVRLLDIYPNYKGPDIYFDFNGKDELIGIEILC
jgi:hypothetical protein